MPREKTRTKQKNFSKTGENKPGKETLLTLFNFGPLFCHVLLRRGNEERGDDGASYRIDFIYSNQERTQETRRHSRSTR